MIRHVCAIWCSVVVVAGCESKPAVTAPARPAAVPLNTSSSEHVQLQDVTAASQLSFVYCNGEEAGESTILESLGGGVGLCDYDLDGQLDLFFPGGGSLGPGQKIQGKMPGLFRRIDVRFDDVSRRAGLAEAQPFYSHGCTIGDYDNDGFSDILVTGYGGVQLWHNQGDGCFLEVAYKSGIRDDSWSTSAGWGDLNGDGDLDLYVVHYVNWSFANHPYCPGTREGQRDICPPGRYEPLPDLVLLNGGDGSFRDASQEVGLRTDGKGLGVLLADIEMDGDLDIYIANDTTDNFLYLNDGSGRFDEQGVIRGVARDDLGVANGSMGVDACDYNRDGLLDLWAANYERESFALYRNEGGGQFLHVSQSTGLTALGGMYVGFGTAFTDLDADGDEDVLIANGHVIKYLRSAPIQQTPLLLVNEKDRFRKARYLPADFFSTPRRGRGLAVGDLDGDLRPDAVFSHINEPPVLLCNRTENQHRHFCLKLIGRQCNRDAVGASVVLQTSAGNLLRQVKGGGSYLSQSELTLHFGLPAGCEVLGATVRWPGGERQKLTASELDGRLILVQPPLGWVQ